MGIRIKSSKKPTKMTVGGDVTPQERAAWNNYVGAMHTMPGYGTVNWDHNQAFQMQAMKKAGFDPGRVSAIQADMLSRNQMMPGAVKAGADGFSKVDNWVGHKTKDQSYTKYEYLHYDPKGNLYPGVAGHMMPTTEPMTSAQMNDWTNSAYKWKSNNQGVPMDAPVEEIKSKLYNQPIMSESLGAKYPGLNKASWYENGPAPDYSIDAIRKQNDVQESKYGGIVMKKGKKMGDGGVNLQLNSAQMMMGALAGADALVTKFLFNPQVQAMEAANKRQLMTPVTAPNQFYGTGQGMYEKGGRVDDVFENPVNPNTIVEGGEHMLLPNGISSPIVGDSHSAPSGGEPRSYPEGTRIFSKKLKAPKGFVSEITDGRVNKSKSWADVANMFKTDKDSKMTGDPITDRTKMFNFKLKNDKLDKIFAAQEASKSPSGPGYMFGGATLAKNGTEVELPPNTLDPWAVTRPDITYPTLPPVDPWANPHEVPAMPPYTLPGQINVPAGRTSDVMPTLQPAPLKTMPTTPHQAAIGPNPDSDYVEPMKTKPVPELPKFKGDKKTKGSFKYDGMKGLGDMLPEAFAAVQNMTDYPIWATKVNPNYIKPAEINTQAAINRNVASSITQRNTGNAAVDNARGALGAAQLYDANNQLAQSKFNAWQQSKESTDAYNASAKARADEVNMRSMDVLLDRMTRRQANKEATNQAIVESAYQKNKQRKLEDTSLGIYNQMMKDWEWDPVTKKYKPKQQTVASMPRMQTTV